MISSNLTQLLGFGRHDVDDDGNVAEITTPFVFPDGDPFPVYVEQSGEALRFFDDGDVISHFMNLVSIDDWKDCSFIEDLARPSGVRLNDQGELEIWTDAAHVPSAFAHYISAMFALARWEQQQEDVAEERRAAVAGANAGTQAPLSA